MTIDVNLNQVIPNNPVVKLWVTDKLPVSNTPGHRNLGLRWKTNKKTGKLLSPKRMVEIPVIQIQSGDPKLDSMVNSLLSDYQKSFIQQWMTDEISAGRSVGFLPNSMTTIAAILDDFHADTAGGTGTRLNSDIIEGWFMDEMLEPLAQYVIGKKPELQNDAEKLNGMMEKYQKLFQDITKRNLRYSVPVAQILYDAVRNCAPDSEIGEKILAKLQPWLQEQTAGDIGIV